MFPSILYSVFHPYRDQKITLINFQTLPCFSRQWRCLDHSFQLWWNATSGIGESGLNSFPSIPAASVIVWETLVTGSSHQLQILSNVVHNSQRFDPEDFPAACIRQVHSAIHRAGGQVVLLSRAVAEQRERRGKESIKLEAATSLSIRNIV